MLELPVEEGVYDKAQWHFMEGFPEELSSEQAFVHIGIFMGWIIKMQLYSEEYEDEAGPQILRFYSRELTCGILAALWDGVLDEEMLSDEGNDFAQDYYVTGKYMKDYIEILAEQMPSFYYVADTWENYDKMAARITKRYNEWLSKR